MLTTDKRRLYIDIDGVINAMRQGTYKVTIITDPDGPVDVRIRIDHETVKTFLKQFDEVVWASSWVMYPGLLAQLERTLGIEPGQFDRITLDRQAFRNSPGHSSGKAQAVAAHYDAHPMPSLWIDDDLGPDDFKVARERGIEYHCPDPREGAYPYMLKFGLQL